MKHHVLDEIDFDIDCPNCNKEFSVNSSQMDSTVTCPHCGSDIFLQDDNFKDALKDANKSIDKLLNGLFK